MITGSQGSRGYGLQQAGPQQGANAPQQQMMAAPMNPPPPMQQQGMAFGQPSQAPALQSQSQHAQQQGPAPTYAPSSAPKPVQPNGNAWSQPRTGPSFPFRSELFANPWPIWWQCEGSNSGLTTCERLGSRWAWATARSSAGTGPATAARGWTGGLVFAAARAPVDHFARARQMSG